MKPSRTIPVHPFLAALVVATVAPAAHAQSGVAAPQATAEAPPRRRGPMDEAPWRRLYVQYRDTLALRINPLGAVNDFRIGLRYHLYDNQRPLFRDAHVGVALNETLSPGWSRTGISAEVAPLTILQLSAQYEFFGSFGDLGTLQSFAAPSAYYLEEGIFKSALSSATARGPHAAAGHIVSFNALLQLRFGPIVIRDGVRFQREWVDHQSGETAYYDSFYDILAPTDGWLVTNDFDLWYYPEGRTFLAGIRYSLVKSLYDGVVAARATPDPTASTSDSTITQRIGPVVGYTFFDHPGARFNAPTVLLIANWWVQHPYRTSWQYSGVPYIGIAFTFRGEL